MRDIIFRGKDVADDVWRYGDLITLRNYTEYCGIREYMTLMGDKFVCDKHTIGQDTGLTDKNGTKIFEGDIVIIECESGFKMKGQVVYTSEAGCFELYDRNYDVSEVLWYAKSEMEVIGNIYDNPELLEGVKE